VYEVPGDERRFVIRNDSAVLHPEVLDELESWDQASWCRRTGYVISCGEKFLVQLRHGVAPVPQLLPSQWLVPVIEVEHYRFCRQFPSDWNEKPNWTSVSG
jgi:hypothetical protein